MSKNEREHIQTVQVVTACCGAAQSADPVVFT